MKRRPGPTFAPTKQRKVPFEFVLDEIAALAPETRPMFGCTAVYVDGKIVFVLRNRPSQPADNGLWIATTPEHHVSLRAELPSLRSIRAFGEGETGWQVLPAEAPDFEEAALAVCALVAARDARIGKVPRLRRPRRARTKPSRAPRKPRSRP